MHGGVYVPVTEYTPPNPYLKNINERDISTPGGKKLTLVNPAYMTRQVYEIAKKELSAQGHITSLNPINQINVADDWEKIALKEFDNGLVDKSEIVEMEGQPFMRYMKRLITEQSCMKCHEIQGYQVGQVRGGISVSVPMKPYYVIARMEIKRIVISYATIYIIFLIGIFISFGFLKREIRKRIQVQQVITESEHKLKIQNIELQAAKLAADESNKLKSAFLANMSHEIRTPMNGIIGFCDLLQDPEIEVEKRTKYAEIVVHSGHQLLNIVNDILDISKIETGQVVVHLSEFKLSELIDDLTDFYNPRIPANVSFVVENRLQPEVIVRTDEIKLKQIITNLLSNALKFTKQGFIKLSIDQDNDYLIFCVEDTGIGLDKKYHLNIFERFRQVEHTTDQTSSGTGLGLAICKSYVELLGGKIWIESQLRIGSRFYFSVLFNLGTTSSE